MDNGVRAIRQRKHCVVAVVAAGDGSGVSSEENMTRRDLPSKLSLKSFPVGGFLDRSATRVAPSLGEHEVGHTFILASDATPIGS